IPTTGLRFFTVYGPWGRPDMSPFIFAQSIISGETIRLYDHGRHSRDFTYVDDIVDGMLRTFDAPMDSSQGTPYAIHNIGNHRSVNLMDYLNVFEKAIGRSAKIELVDKQPGDVDSTFADITSLQEGYGYQPSTPIETGIGKFVAWYREYYGV
ncbi:MAG: NAD-dependent epimerase/dehydratase family protein, partial [Pseudomonadota bacterium]